MKKMKEKEIGEIGDIFNKLYVYLSSLAPGRQTEAKLLLLSLIAKHHVVFIGPPGTGKSFIIKKLTKIFSVPYFETQIHPAMKPSELFGMYDPKIAREEGKLVLRTENKLPEAKIAFLDEIFEDAPALHSALLTVLNERTFSDSRGVIKMPLWTVMGASNQPPEKKSFFDRFLFIHFNDYLTPELWDDYLRSYWNAHKKNTNTKEPSLDFSVIEQAHKYLWNVDVLSSIETLKEIFMQLRDHGVRVSDRRMGRTLIALAASAVFHGRLTTKVEDFEVLKYVLALKKEDVVIIENVLSEVIGKVFKAKSLLDEIEATLKSFKKDIETMDRSQINLVDIAQRVEVITNKLHKIQSITKKDTSMADQYKKLEELAAEIIQVATKRLTTN